MNRSDTIAELAGALAKAQGSFEAVERNREVEVTMKSGGKYKFSYATLDNIVEMIRLPLSANGLAYVQGVNGSENGTVVETLLTHSSGQWIQTATPVRIEDSKAQSLGSGITYAKRYALTALLGIVAEEDDDGNDADGNTKVVKDKPSTRSADDANWRGPLGKSQLKKELRALGTDIAAVEDSASLLHLLNTHAYLLEQCPADLPDWWAHKNGGTAGGLKITITQQANKLGCKVGPLIDEFEIASESKPLKQAAE